MNQSDIKENKITEDFARDCLRGLQSKPKVLQSKYFYDDRGSRIFQKIMNLSDYYLTTAEVEIFKTHSAEFVSTLSREKSFHLIELGCGDGVKTKILLNEITRLKYRFSFVPIDISESIVDEFSKNLHSEFPDITIEPYIGDYLDTLDLLHRDRNFDEIPRLVLFLGSNLGNFSGEEAYSFLERLGRDLNSGDLFLIGLDLVKNPHRIRNAYDDKEGITSEFNLNLLDRINRELGGDFDRTNFTHYTYYDIRNQEVLSYLVSLKDQDVRLDYGKARIHFSQWEKIFTERSRKFTFSDIEDLAKANGFRILKNYTDSQGFFCNSLWEKL